MAYQDPRLLTGKWTMEAQQVRMDRALSEAVAKVCTSKMSQEDREHLLERHRSLWAADEGGARILEPLQPHSCRHCRRLIIDASGPINYGMSRHQIHPKLVVFADFTLADVRVAADDGCGLCQRVLKQLKPSKKGENKPDHDFSLFTYLTGGARGDFDVSTIAHFCVWDGKRMWTKWDNEEYEGCYFDVFARKDNPASNFITAREINTSTASEESFKLARSWLGECQLGHPSCQSVQSQFSPSRLVKIEEVDHSLRTRLYHPVDYETLEYATLSYCWGGPQDSQTTTASMRLHGDEIDFEALPQTIKDALTTTWRLRISYLWVDSLCIIQDSPADKAIGLAQMTRIYANAKVTISASRATHVEEGFLHPRKATDEPNFCFELPYRLPSSGELGSVVLFHEAPEVSDNVLQTRAWAFQERLLSPRILDFSGSQMRWSCNGIVESPDYADGGTLTYGWKGVDTLRDAIVDMNFNLAKDQRKYRWLVASAVKIWQDLVTAYTQCDLTVSTDRPLAIAGVAEVCGGAFNDRYAAGLWRGHPPGTLMWSMKCRTSRLPRPDVYQGPSWSWTSVDGPVHFWESEDSQRGESTFQVLECDVELEHESVPFGAVSRASLVVRGRTQRARWMRNNLTTFSQTNDTDILASGSDDEEEAFLAAAMLPDALESDWADPEVHSIDVVLLEVGYRRADEDDWAGAKGLVLRPLGDGFFSRLGIFCFEYSEACRLYDCVNGTGEGPEESNSQPDGSADTETAEHKDRQVERELRKRGAMETIWKKYRRGFDGCDEEVLVII